MNKTFYDWLDYLCPKSKWEPPTKLSIYLKSNHAPVKFETFPEANARESKFVRDSF